MLRRRSSLAALTALALPIALSACGSSDSASSATGQTGTTQAAARGPRGGFTSDPAVTKCLKAAGITLPARPTGTAPQGAPPARGTGTTPQGAPPAGGGPGGFGGGLTAQARAALAKCGVQLPQGGPGGGPGGTPPATTTTQGTQQ